jgi:Spx/MgsR family transcriptional regulator
MKAKLRVYSYNGCSTCRDALKFLAEHKIPHEILPIRETPPRPAELRTMLKYVGREIRKLFNTSGLDYKAMNLKDRISSISIEEALNLLSTNGKLVKRPFVLGESFGLLGFKPKEWSEKLG